MLANVPVAAAPTDSAVELAPLLLVLVAAWVGGWLARRVGYPAVLGELVAGVVFGPPLLGILGDGAGLDVLAELGVLIMMLAIGTSLDLDDLRRASVPGALAAVGGFVVPAGLGTATVLAFGGDLIAALFIGAALGVTSLATKSRILADLDLFDTRIAHVLMAGALLSDTAVLIAFAVLIGFAEAGVVDVGELAGVAGQIVLFLAIAVLAAVLLPRVVGILERRRRLEGAGGFGLAVAVGLVLAEVAVLTGLHPIIGAFVGGMLLRRIGLTPRVFSEASRRLTEISIGFLAPVFFVTAGFAVTFDVVFSEPLLLITILAVATFGKILGTALFYLPSGHGWREGITVGAGMNGRGAVEIIVAGIGLELGVISSELFTVLVITAILTTATVPVLLPLCVRWLRSRGELATTRASRRGIVLIGAGPVGRALAQALHDTRPVTLVDSNLTHCQDARDGGLDAIHGDALDPSLLEDAGAGSAEAVVALTANAEVNVLAAQVAGDQHHVPELHVALGDATPALRVLAARIGAGPLLDVPVDIEAWDQRLATEHASPRWLDVAGDRKAMFSMLRTGVEGLPLAVRRDGDVVPFPLVDDLRAGDAVWLLTSSSDAHRNPVPTVR